MRAAFDVASDVVTISHVDDGDGFGEGGSGGGEELRRKLFARYALNV